MELHVGVSCHRLVTKALIKMTLRRGLLISTYYSPKCIINHSLSHPSMILHTYLSMTLSPVSWKFMATLAWKVFCLSAAQHAFYIYTSGMWNKDGEERYLPTPLYSIPFPLCHSYLLFVSFTLILSFSALLRTWKLVNKQVISRHSGTDEASRCCRRRSRGHRLGAASPWVFSHVSSSSRAASPCGWSHCEVGMSFEVLIFIFSTDDFVMGLYVRLVL